LQVGSDDLADAAPGRWVLLWRSGQEIGDRNGHWLEAARSNLKPDRRRGTLQGRQSAERNGPDSNRYQLATIK